MILFTTQEATLPSLPETPAIAAEVQTDLQQLKPHVILDTIRGWMPGLLTLAYRLAIAALIIVIGLKLAGSLRKFLKKTFDRMNMDLGLSKFLISLANATAYAVIIFMALEKIGIPSASIIALLGSATLAIGLSLQGCLANFAGGILILVMRPFSINDYIICPGGEGTVHSIGLVYTTLMTVDNRKIIIPNGNLSNDVITNVTAQEKRRLEIKIGISYYSDIKQAKNILSRLCHEHPLVLKDEDIAVFVDELADSAVILGLRAWTATDDYWTAKWNLTEQLKEAFDAAGIVIPFNQLDVNLKS